MKFEKKEQIIVLISADIEWEAVHKTLSVNSINPSPIGEWFVYPIKTSNGYKEVVFFHGGWGKISAAASTQYVIDHWSPSLLINLGTCGGFEGEIEKGRITLADRTVVYDIVEQMGDYEEHIAHYTTDIDLSWLDKNYPIDVLRTTLVSGDRDLDPADIQKLKSLYGAVAGDWESGAIAFVAVRNDVRLFILRGVTDLVGNRGGEAYGNIENYKSNAEMIIAQLLESLPRWLELVVD